MGYSCPKIENPADYFIDILTIDSTSEKTTQESDDRVDNIIESARNKPHVHTSEGEKSDFNDKDLNQNNKGGAGFLKQLALLTHRTAKNTLRDVPLLVGRTVQNVLLVCMIIILFIQMDNDQTSIQDRISVVFMCLLGLTFSESVAGALVCK